VIIMIVTVPYIFPGKVMQISTKGDSSEVILAFENSTLEITVLITKTTMADLALKENVPAYAAIMWLKEAIPPGSGKKMINVQAGNQTWVTIPWGPATEAEIIAARDKIINNHCLPSPDEKKAWSFGYVTFEEFNQTTQNTLLQFNGCAPASSTLQIETIRYQDGTWVTIPYSPECEAKILNKKEQYKNTVQKPSLSLLEAWSHGYSSEQTFSEAPGSANGFRVNGPTLAGFVYTGQNRNPNLFISSGSSIGENAWAVPVNIYIGSKKIGQSQVATIEL